MGRFSLEFDTVEGARDIRALAGFLHENPGTYGDGHERWVEEVCIPQVDAGKRVALVWKQAGRITADAIIKTDEEELNRTEIKNFRAAPTETSDGLEITGCGDFMMRQTLAMVPVLAREQARLSDGAENVTVYLDTTQGNPAVTFFERHGFSQIGTGELYIPGQVEVLMERTVPVAA